MKKISNISSLLLAAGIFISAIVNGQGKAAKKSECTFLGAVVYQTSEKCYGQATADAAVAPLLGGTAPYTYSWSPTATNLSGDTIDVGYNLPAGTYTVTITDANGCTASVIVSISQPSQITAKNTVTNDNCYGSSNGEAIVKATGGTPGKLVPYTYAWTPAVSTTDTGKNLTAGSYIVTITDSNRCKGSDTVTITQPVQIKTITDIVPSSCKVVNGSAGVTPSLGVSPYTYKWSPGGQTTDSITGLAAGNYSCTVTDANGCTVVDNVIVSDSTTLTSKVVAQSNEKCYGNTMGLAQIHVTGGMGKVTYNWSPSGGTDTIAGGLGAGTYTFTATDSVGCKSLLDVMITQPNQLRDSAIGTRNVACFGSTTGRVTDGIKGGTGPYTYTWSTGATTSNLTNVAAGTYSVMVTDANGCLDSMKITLTQPATAVTDSNKVTTIACYGGTASATVFAYGGVHPYTYAWSGGSSNTTNSATGLTAGTYVCSIRDSNRCRVRDTITIVSPPSFILATDTALHYPCNNSAWVQVTGTLSKYTFNWSPSGGNKDTASSLCNGTYVVIITDSTGCVENDTIMLNNTVGIATVNNQEGISVYPVPAKYQINVSITGNSFIPQAISVFDITGRELLNEPVNASAKLYTLDVSKLAEGTYFIKLTGNGEKIVKFTVAGR